MCAALTASPNKSVDSSTQMPAVRFVTVDERNEGQRLDNFLLGELKGVPKTRIYRMLRTGEVRVNKARAQADTRLVMDDLVRIPPVRVAEKENDGEQELRVKSQSASIQWHAVFEDAALLVIDKPAGLAVHGGSGVSFGVIEALRAQRQPRFLELVHRLDRETSGLLVLAFKRSALLHCQDQFRAKTTHKVYRAVVLGHWPLRTKTLRQPLFKTINAQGERHVLVRADGKEAITHATGLRHARLPNGQEITELEVRIETGRTHQIRVHLSHAGFPILGDERYGNFELNKTLSKQLGAKRTRMYLHAEYLEITHPVSAETLKLTASPPTVFQELFSQ